MARGRGAGERASAGRPQRIDAGPPRAGGAPPRFACFSRPSHRTGTHTRTIMACSHSAATPTEPQILQAILAELQQLKSSHAHLEHKVCTRSSPLRPAAVC